MTKFDPERTKEVVRAFTEATERVSDAMRRCTLAIEQFAEIAGPLATACAIEEALGEATTRHTLAAEVYRCPVVFLDDVLRLRDPHP